MALTRLLDVMDKSKELLEKLKGPWKTESKFNVFLACKVIQPLTGGTCIINSVKDEDKAVMKNSDVKLPDDFGLTGIAMGYEDGYYGEPDIIACPEEQSQNVHEGPGAVVINSVPSVEEPDETGVSPGKRKRSVSEHTTISALSQTIATALTFAKIQQERHSEHHTFPTLRMHPLGVDIILYNAVSDHLMLSCSAWSEHALFMLWLVLHHNLFRFVQLPKGYEKYTSGFLDYIKASGAMKTEPKYLVLKNGFELEHKVIKREYISTAFRKIIQ